MRVCRMLNEGSRSRIREHAIRATVTMKLRRRNGVAPVSLRVEVTGLFIHLDRDQSLGTIPYCDHCRNDSCLRHPQELRTQLAKCHANKKQCFTHDKPSEGIILRFSGSSRCSQAFNTIGTN